MKAIVGEMVHTHDEDGDPVDQWWSVDRDTDGRVIVYLSEGANGDQARVSMTVDDAAAFALAILDPRRHGGKA